MRSMTGYGLSESNFCDGVSFSVELRAVNRKQLDIKLMIPAELYEHELELRRILSSKISRGTISVKILINVSGELLNNSLNFNKDLAAAYYKRVLELQELIGDSSRVTAIDVLKLPNVISEMQPLKLTEQNLKVLYDTFDSALEKFNSSRCVEGSFLKEDIVKRISHLSKLLTQIEPLSKSLPEVYKKQLKEKIERENLFSLDDDRLTRELVIFSDKCDVSEEITRLKSHFQQFGKLLQSDEESIGRNLDFLAQEIFREINTLGNKALNSEISHYVVEFKTEAEKIREQIQNIE